jgi:elongation factor G
MGDINARRGLVLETSDRGMAKVVSAHVPLSEMFGYATDMRSMTQGRASYSMEPSHYAKLPKNVADAVIAERTGGAKKA